MAMFHDRSKKRNNQRQKQVRNIKKGVESDRRKM